MGDTDANRTPEMQAAIGTVGEPAVLEVTRTGIRAFALAVGYTDPVYFDAEAARSAGYPDLLAPVGYFGAPAGDPRVRRESRQPDFREQFPRTLHGGSEIEMVERVFAGETLRATTTLKDVRVVPSKTYERLLVRVSETEYRRASDDRVVAYTRNTGLAY